MLGVLCVILDNNKYWHIYPDSELLVHGPAQVIYAYRYTDDSAK